MDIRLVILLLIAGCATQKRCEKKFPTIPVEHKIEYIEKIVTDSVFLPADTLEIVTEVPCDDFSITIENEALKTSILVLNKRLNAVVTKKADTVFIQGKEIIKTEYIKEVVIVKECNKVIRSLAYIGSASLLIFLTLIFAKIKNIA
jgi:hypothetical protein